MIIISQALFISLFLRFEQDKIIIFGGMIKDTNRFSNETLVLSLNPSEGCADNNRRSSSSLSVRKKVRGESKGGKGVRILFGCTENDRIDR